jgi:hypothetical protein
VSRAREQIRAQGRRSPGPDQRRGHHHRHGHGDTGRGRCAVTDARFPERWLNDRRVLRLPDDAFRLFVCGLAWSVANKTDGYLSDEDLRLIPGVNLGAAVVLQDAELWWGHMHGWQITEFEDTQTSAAQLEAAALARRANDRKRQARHRRALLSRDSSRDNPRDNTRTGQARPGKAPRNVVPGQSTNLGAGSAGQSSNGSFAGPAPQATAQGGPGGRRVPPGTVAGGSPANEPAPPQSLRDHDGPEPGGSDVQHDSIEVHRQSQATDRYAREDRPACPVCGVKQRLRANGKLSSHGPRGAPCRGSGLVMTGAAP